jgi:hypothetical protein
MYDSTQMGVSLECGTYCVKSSYSCLHHVRRMWFDAAVAYLKTLEPTEPRDCLLNMLERVYSDTAADPEMADYDYLQEIMVPLTGALTAFRITGLYWFIVSSDCDGRFSVGQATDICETLERITKHIFFFQGPTRAQDYAYYRVFKESVDKRVPVLIS